jgi:hypothetical protein
MIESRAELVLFASLRKSVSTRRGGKFNFFPIFSQFFFATYMRILKSAGPLPKTHTLRTDRVDDLLIFFHLRDRIKQVFSFAIEWGVGTPSLSKTDIKGLSGVDTVCDSGLPFHCVCKCGGSTGEA